MSEQYVIDPVAILKEIEDRCRVCEAGFPRKAEVSNEWAGIAFRLGCNKLVAPMDDVIEILDLPALSNVPLTQPWVRGIANVRGSLLPVIDLNGYLGNEVPRVTNKTRVLVIDFNGIYSGLVVDEVLAVGDVGFRAKCYNKIAELQNNCAVVIVSHNMPTIARISSKCMVLNNGHSIYQGTPEEAIQQYSSLFDEEKINIQKEGAKAKPYQVRQVRSILVKNKLLDNDDV